MIHSGARGSRVEAYLNARFERSLPNAAQPSTVCFVEKLIGSLLVS